MPQSPKQRFQATADREWHERLVNSLAFENALDVAMVQFVNEFGKPTSSEMAATQYAMIEGAKQFIRAFNGLSSLPSKENKLPPGQLDYSK